MRAGVNACDVSVFSSSRIPVNCPLLDQGKAEDRLRLSVAQIVVRREQVGFGGIIENHAFPRADDIADEGSRDRRIRVIGSWRIVTSI